MKLFLFIVLTLWGIMHLYVFWRWLQYPGWRRIFLARL